MVAHLEPEQASPVLALLPEELRLDIAYRLGTMEEIHPDILKELSEVLEAELKVGSKSQGQQLGGVEFLADVMNALDKTTEQALTSGLAERNADLAESVRQLMFVFDDLAGVEDRGLQDLLKEIAKEDLLLALRAAPGSRSGRDFPQYVRAGRRVAQRHMEAGGPVNLAMQKRRSATFYRWLESSRKKAASCWEQEWTRDAGLRC